MGATDRMRLYLEEKGISKYSFYKKTGLSNKFLDNSSNMGTDKTEIIIRYYPDINIEWLITGKGDMIKTATDTNTPSQIINSNTKPYYEIANYKPRPFIDCYGILGTPNGFEIAIKADECEQISIPFVSDYDFSIKGRGDSMINRKSPDRSICDGDLIACKIWASRSYVQWGQVYALATSQGVVVKQIKESEKTGCIKCVSFNEEDGYTPYDIPIEEIHDWAIVVAVTHTAKW